MPWIVQIGACRIAATSNWQVIGTRKTGYISQCAYGIAVDATTLVVAVAPTTGTKGNWRAELLRFKNTHALKPLVARFNAVEHKDGTMHLD